MDEKKVAAAVLLLMLVLVLSSLVDEAKSEAPSYDCNDLCTTGCAASYINNDRLRQRCERKCSIKCSPGRAADGGRP